MSFKILLLPPDVDESWPEKIRQAVPGVVAVGERDVLALQRLDDEVRHHAAVERMRKLSQPVQMTGTRDWDVTVVDSTRLVLTPSPSGTTRSFPPLPCTCSASRSSCATSLDIPAKRLPRS